MTDPPATAALVQVGWMLPPDLAARFDVTPLDDGYLFTVEQANRDGGIRPEFADHEPRRPPRGGHVATAAFAREGDPGVSDTCPCAGRGWTLTDAAARIAPQLNAAAILRLA